MRNPRDFIRIRFDGEIRGRHADAFIDLASHPETQIFFWSVSTACFVCVDSAGEVEVFDNKWNVVNVKDYDAEFELTMLVDYVANRLRGKTHAEVAEISASERAVMLKRKEEEENARSHTRWMADRVNKERELTRKALETLT